MTFAYMTSRKDCQFQWWIDSLRRELKNDFSKAQIIVVDFWSQVLDDWPQESVNVRLLDLATMLDRAGAKNYKIIPPKPNVWQGRYRLTKDHWFAAANARNTAIALAEHEYIVFCDDLSVIIPGWLNAIHEMCSPKLIICGAYRKVRKLVVNDGRIITYEDSPNGHDHRPRISQNGPAICGGGWLYGCSFAVPMEALLEVNGLDENCDSLSSEDYILGIRLANAGYGFIFDPRVMTWESEEGHLEGVRMYRRDKRNSTTDKSHEILRMARESKWAPNYFGNGGLRALRQQMLNGGSFPILQSPEHDWFDGQKVSDF